MYLHLKGNIRGKAFTVVLAVFVLLGAPHMSDAATFKVTTGIDSGAGSLRQAIANANNDNQVDIIEIDPSVKEIKISGTIDITGDVVINGQGTTVRGTGGARLFSVTAGTIKFDRVTFIDAYSESENGGAFYIDSTRSKVAFVNCTFFNNYSGGSGGAVYLYGNGSDATTFVNCTLVNNEAAVGGGGVAVFGGTIQFTASIVTGNKAPNYADVYTGSTGIILNSGWYNVIGQTNADVSFLSQFKNFLSVSSTDIFKTPYQLTTVDGVQVLPLLSATSNAALDLIPSANTANLPTVDERGASRPQMIAIDAGAFELSPVALASIDLTGGSYVQKGTSEKYSVLVYPEDTTLDVRNYEDGIEWTVVNPPYSEIISVDRYGNVTGLATGQATLRATAHGWNSRGVEMTATDTTGITVGEQPLPAPTVSVVFDSPKLEMKRDNQQTLKLKLNIEPKDTPYTVLFESSDPTTATVYQSSSASTTAIVKALSPGQTVIRVTVTAQNSKGRQSDYDEFLLTVTERSSGGGGGGGCNGGFGIASFVLTGLLILKGKKQ